MDSSKITKALPIVTVLTLSATGSEMNGNAVISNLSTNEKIGLSSDLVRPRASIPVSYTHLDEVWVAEKFQSNPEIAGSLRNSFRASLVLDSRR